MCLGIPGRIVRLDDAANALATVDVCGVRRQINIDCIIDDAHPFEACLGDWVLVHVGFAMSRIDEAEAAETLEDPLRARRSPGGDRGDDERPGRGGAVVVKDLKFGVQFEKAPRPSLVIPGPAKPEPGTHERGRPEGGADSCTKFRWPVFLGSGFAPAARPGMTDRIAVPNGGL